VELADTLGSGLSEHCAREGSNPSFGTKKRRHQMSFFILKSSGNEIIIFDTYLSKANFYPNYP
jgi:hypothetical protein